MLDQKIDQFIKPFLTSMPPIADYGGKKDIGTIPVQG